MYKGLFMLISEQLQGPQLVEACVFLSHQCCVAMLQPRQCGLLLVHPAVRLSLRQGAHVPGQMLVSNITYTSCLPASACLSHLVI